jgi:hypothetical protein
MLPDHHYREPVIRTDMDVHQVQIVLGVILIAAAFLIGVWDAACLYRGVQTWTVSSIIQRWSAAYPILPFAMGILAGHVFWPVRSSN